MVVMTNGSFEIEGLEGDVLVLLQLLDELQEGRVADDVDAFGVGRRARSANIRRRPAADGLFGQDVGLRRVRAAGRRSP